MSFVVLTLGHIDLNILELSFILYAGTKTLGSSLDFVCKPEKNCCLLSTVAVDPENSFDAIEYGPQCMVINLSVFTVRKISRKHWMSFAETSHRLLLS